MTDWSRTRIVLIAPTGDQQLQDVRAVLQSWAAVGVLHEFLWCDVDETDRLVRVGRDGCEEVDTGAALKGASAYRAVFLHRPTGPDFDQAEEVRVKDQLRRAAPMTDGTALPTPLHLVIPDRLETMTGGQRDDGDLVGRATKLRLDRTNEPIVLVVPEDRSDPWEANRGIDEGRYPPHAAQAIASLLGLWSSATGDLSPVGLAPVVGEVGSAIAVRSFSRVIEAGHLPDLLAVGAVRFDGRWPVPDPQVLSAHDGGLPVPSLQRLAESYTQKHASVLLGTPLKVVQPSGSEPVTLLVALKRIWQALVSLFFHWTLSKVEGLVRGAYNRARNPTQKLADLLTGQEVLSWEDEEAGAASDEALRQRPGELMPNDGPITSAWLDYSKLAFSLIDGSPLPEQIDDAELSSGGRRRYVVELPHQIAPRPVRSGVRSLRDENRACDPLRADPDLAGEAAQPMEPGRLSRARASLCWMVGMRIGAAAEAAEASASRLGEELAAARERLDQLEAAFKAKLERLERMLRTVKWAVVAVAAFGCWRWWSPADGRVTRLLALVAGALIVLVVVALFVNKRRNALIVELAEARALPPLLELQQRYWAQVADALRRRYREYLDWSDIIAELVHEPWKVPPAEPPEVSAFAACDRPEATRFAVGCFTETAVMGKITSVRNDLFGRGWLLGWARQVVDEAMGRLREERGLDEAAGLALLDPWADRSVDEMGARRYLRRYLREGLGRALDDSPVAEQVRAAVSEVPITTLLSGIIEVDQVEERSRDVDNAGDPGQTVVRVRCRRANDVWAGSGVVIADTGLALTNRHVVDSAAAVEVQFADEDRWVKASVLAVSDICDLAVVAPAVAVARRRAVTFAPSAHAGDVVRSTGYPEQVDGTAITVHGTLAGLRQAVEVDGVVSSLSTFQLASAPGASGSGIFDGRGALISLLVGGSRREGIDVPEYLTVGVPLDDLREFLSDLEAEGIISLPIDPSKWVALGADQARSSEVEDFLAPVRRDAPSRLLPDHFVGGAALPVTARVLPEQVFEDDLDLDIAVGEPIRFVHVRIEETENRPLHHFYVAGLRENEGPGDGGGGPAPGDDVGSGPTTIV